MALATGLSYTGFNGALTQVNGGNNGLSGSSVSGKSLLEHKLARALKHIPNMALRAYMRAATQGGASQALQTTTYVRRQGATGMSPQGGLIIMETVTPASGSTVAADVTEITAQVFDKAFAPTAAIYTTGADKSGNGGGGKGKY